ncbi:MAG: indolepyruvate ferredoxin oxidoreductase subunit alpha [Chloroflexi bacterium]|jgi:indolepyruvate ferredoxin oxidoreductase, alpha subunit|nr:indolepyruvate ferredoxin oxidoreductase subunit alpha [Chloroflexota bacterium]
MKQLLSGNEAIALGAYHSGMGFATAYPGTPSTEILQNISSMEGVYSEWSINEKVALEVGIGAAYAGIRTLVTMKHVGLNVAADPFFALATTGTNAGIIVVSCDDPGEHSSQGEQDNRHFAKFAKVPMIEPTDSQEAYELMDWAFKISEEFDTPVLFRSTTRISHCKSVVNVNRERPSNVSDPKFLRSSAKYVMVPSNARVRRIAMEERIAKLREYVENFPLNEMIMGDRKLGVISSGIAYQNAREVFNGASFLKLVTTYPIPEKLIRKFASEVEKVIVIEELDPHLEEEIRLLGIDVSGKDFIPIIGELNPEIVEAGAIKSGLIPTPPRSNTTEVPAVQIPPRRPQLCAGCPHVGPEFILRKIAFDSSVKPSLTPREMTEKEMVITSDIGCYTLGVYEPLGALDTCVCMGASIGVGLGMSKAGIPNKGVAVLGDSTFMHSGVTGLIDVVYKQGNTTVLILDNRTTAMTGHQGHPGTGVSVTGTKGPEVNLEKLCEGIGIKDITVISAFDLETVESTIRRCVETDEPSVIIARGPCALREKIKGTPFEIDADSCIQCHECLDVGCPAICITGEDINIDPAVCVGPACGVCAQVCPSEAIVEMKR